MFASSAGPSALPIPFYDTNLGDTAADPRLIVDLPNANVRMSVAGFVSGPFVTPTTVVGASVSAALPQPTINVATTAGFPAITVPLGLRAVGSIIDPLGITNVGMPVGITFIGKPGDDARLLAFAYAFEQATNLRVLPTLK